MVDRAESRRGKQPRCIRSSSVFYYPVVPFPLVYCSPDLSILTLQTETIMEKPTIKRKNLLTGKWEEEIDWQKIAESLQAENQLFRDWLKLNHPLILMDYEKSPAN